MRKFKEINSLHEKTVPKALKPGEKVQYVLLGTKFDKKEGRWIGPSSQNIPSVFTIFDDNKQENVDCAYIRTVRKDDYELGEIEFFKHEGFVKTLTNRPEDMEQYQIMELHPRNAANAAKYGVTPMFEKVEPEKSAAKKREERRQTNEALSLAIEMDDDQIKAMVNAMGKDTSLDIEILRDIVEKYAQEKPQEFILRGVSVSEEIEIVVKEAEGLNVLIFKKEDNSWYWTATDEKLKNVPRGPKYGKYKTLSEFLAGEDEIYEELKLQVQTAKRVK